MTIEYSKLGLWNNVYENEAVNFGIMYGDDYTAKLASEWLNQDSITTIEDWGCGYGGFKNFIAPHQTYIGVDGSNTPFADKIVDLSMYETQVDAIHLRHVIEHNQNWKIILENFLSGFTKKAVLTLFTPFMAETTTVAAYENWRGTGTTMVDISLSYDELMSIISKHQDIKVKTELNLNTHTQYKVEHVFYLEKQLD